VSKPYDATAKDLLEAHPGSWMEYLHLRSRGPVCVIDADLSTVTTEADKVLRVDDEPQPWLVHIELQAGRDRRFVPRLLRYNVLLNYRHELPVLSVVVLLRPEADAPDLTGAIERVLPDGRGYLRFQYHVVRAWQQPVDAVLRGGLGTLPMAPLADVAREDQPNILRRVFERFRNEASPNEAARLWTATELLMGLRYPPAVVDQILQGVGEMDILGIHGIEESSIYQKILAEGIAQGIARGIAQGTAQEAKRILIRVGQKRFGPPEAGVVAAIEGITDRERVEALIERLDEVSSWEALLASPGRE
jgi:hypothetical protein